MEVSTIKPSIDRLERFQSLESGQYWKALESIPEEAIEAGEVLLIESVRLVDKSAHTIILRAHPLKYDKYVTVQRTKDGHTSTLQTKLTQHRFLTDVFMRLFEYEPDYERIRTNEILKIQGKVNDLQQELVNTQSDPEAMALIVQEELDRENLLITPRSPSQV